MPKDVSEVTVSSPLSKLQGQKGKGGERTSENRMGSEQRSKRGSWEGQRQREKGKSNRKLKIKPRWRAYCEGCVFSRA